MDEESTCCARVPIEQVLVAPPLLDAEIGANLKLSFIILLLL